MANSTKSQPTRKQLEWSFPRREDEKGYVLMMETEPGSQTYELVTSDLPATHGLEFEKAVAKALGCKHEELGDTLAGREAAVVHKHFWQTAAARVQEEESSDDDS